MKLYFSYFTFIQGIIVPNSKPTVAQQENLCGTNKFNTSNSIPYYNPGPITIEKESKELFDLKIKCDMFDGMLQPRNFLCTKNKATFSQLYNNIFPLEKKYEFTKAYRIIVHELFQFQDPILLQEHYCPKDYICKMASWVNEYGNWDTDVIQKQLSNSSDITSFSIPIEAKSKFLSNNQIFTVIFTGPVKKQSIFYPLYSVGVGIYEHQYLGICFGSYIEYQYDFNPLWISGRPVGLFEFL